MDKRTQLITEAITKAVISTLPLLIRKIVREEIELELIKRGTVISENVKAKVNNKVKNKSRNIATVKELYEGSFENVYKKVELPSTGNRLLDEAINDAPSEDELIRKTTRSQEISNEKPIPIEDIYLNDIKKVSANLAENIDYSAFVDMMDKNRTMDEGTASIMGAGMNKKALFVKDPNSIVEEQRVGQSKVEKEYKM
jgi:hypothetical protein